MSNKSNIQKLLKSLETIETLRQNAGIRSNSKPMREININWIEHLNRKGLKYGKKEKMVLFHETRKEKIYIRYPGKESENTTPKPWDFRPVIFLNEDKKFYQDLSFGDIWDGLFYSLEELDTSVRELAGVTLIVFFYRMAYMLDHTEHSLDKAKTIIGHNKSWKENNENLGKCFIYLPPMKLLENLRSLVPQICGISIEAFLAFNDLLAWNEDCKFYYRDVQTGSSTWIGATGRVNTLLTHANIIAALLRKVPLSKVLMGFVHQRGVSPITFSTFEKCM